MQIFLTLLLNLLSFSVFAAESQDAEFCVIVNNENSAVLLEKKLVADIFLKKVTRWSNNEIVKPVDLPLRSAVRERFSQEVLQRSVMAVANYWQQAIFSGRGIPPPEYKTDSDVIKYVAENKSAIGYISVKSDASRVKIVKLE